MRCEEFKSNLLEHLAGEPGTTPQHAVECAACAAELAEFRKTFDLLDEWSVPEPSPYFDTRLKARLREAAVEPTGWKSIFAAKWFRYARVPALAGALGAAILTGVNVYHSQVSVPVNNHECAVNDLQSLDKNYDLLKDLDTLDDPSSDQPNDAEL